jgi:putative transposase
MDEKREFEYIRHGTLCLTASFMVATGKVIAPTVTPTRTEEDFCGHLQRTVATNPSAGWVFVVDNLNTHCSESLVRWIAKLEGVQDLGNKGQNGILHNMQSRSAFLSDPTHRLRLLYTPKHCSWLNQVEIWFSILARRALKRASFSSTQELGKALLAFIEYFNRVLAKPFRWTYKGRPLTA